MGYKSIRKTKSQLIDFINNSTGDVFPGAVIWVCYRGEVILHQAFGVKWYGKIDDLVEEPVNTNTIFDCASLSKTIATGTLAMKLFEQGKLDLEEPVSDIIREFKGEAREKVLIHHLLTHSSGLPAWRPYAQKMMDLCPMIKPGSLDARKLILSWICSEAFEYQTGTMSVYSDLGFILLGFILEEKGLKSLDKLFKHYVTDPLGLVKTFYLSHEQADTCQGMCRPKTAFAATEICAVRKKLIIGEVHDDNAYILGNIAGHAGVFTTAEEYGRWVLEIRKAIKKLTGLFKPSTVRLFLSRKYTPAGSTRVLAFDTKSKYGSSAGSKFSERSIGHLGFTGCSFWFDPEKDLIVVLLTNRVHPTRENEKIKDFRPQLHDAVVEMISD